MIIDYSNLSKISPFKKNTKQKIIIINKFIKTDIEDIIYNSLKKSISIPTKIFKNRGMIIKKEYNNKNRLDSNFKDLFNELNSKKFIKFLCKIFNIRKLYADGNNLYSGINVSTNKSFLNEHVDFNYNNELGKFRIVNLLLYFNKNYKPAHGGKFYYRDIVSKQKHYINPSFNKAVIFMTNKFIPHGFTTVKKKRISLNLYYYTNKNLSLSKKKHKTLWF